MTQTAAASSRPASGLEGVVATSSDICMIDGVRGHLVYRGYEIEDLVENAGFEEVAYLLWNNKLPASQELSALRSHFAAAAVLPLHAMTILRTLPQQTLPMDALRTTVSALSSIDPDLSTNDPESNQRKAIRLTAQLPTIVAAFHRIRNRLEPIEPDASLTLAGNLLYMLNGKKPHETLARVMDAALVLHAEHGMNASTFAARVIAATLADMHAAVTGAIAALKGPLHGGANQDVMELLMEAATPDVLDAKVHKMLANRQKVPGFGHRVYRTFDPRAHFLRRMSKQLGEAAGNTHWYEMSERLIPIMKQEKNLNPNVDFFSASAYYTMGIPLDLFTPVFAVARIAGWTAHIMEQHSNNRIIRPTDEYTGPTGLKVTPIEQRG